MALNTSRRYRGPAHSHGTGAGAALGDPRRGCERRRVSDRGAALDAIADRIVTQYGVDRGRALASADLYMRQLRRCLARAGY